MLFRSILCSRRADCVQGIGRGHGVLEATPCPLVSCLSCCSIVSLGLHGEFLKSLWPGECLISFLSPRNVLGSSASFLWWISLMAILITLDFRLAPNPVPFPGKFTGQHPQPAPSSLHKTWKIWISSSPYHKSSWRNPGAQLGPFSSTALLYFNAADPTWSWGRPERQPPCKLPSRRGRGGGSSSSAFGFSLRAFPLWDKVGLHVSLPSCLIEGPSPERGGQDLSLPFSYH